MVWYLPPGRGGRAPQASRHSSRADVPLGVGMGETAGGGLAAAAALDAALFKLGVVAGLIAESVPGFEQAAAMAASPLPPASCSSQRRLTSCGPLWTRSGGGVPMTETIRKARAT